MFTLKIQNANREIFELTHNQNNYALISVEGLTLPPVAINAATGGNMDGTFFNSARVQERNLVITVQPRGQNIEANRQRLYQMFPAKKKCTIFFANKNRNVQISGYVEALEGSLFELPESVMISIICPRPFWQDMETIYTELSQTMKMFQFPFAIEANDPIPVSEIVEYPLCNINNGGEVETGLILTISITTDVNGLTVYNTTTSEFIGFNYSFEDGDTITINTISGQMGVSVLRNGQTINLLNYLINGISWFKLALGENQFTFTASEGANGVDIMFATANLYGGV